jgi:hypothetical protein
MMARIIYIVVGGFTFRDCERYGTNIFQHNGFAVSVWDLTEMLHPQTLAENKDYEETDVEIPAVFEIHSKDEMIRELSCLSRKDFIINTLSFDTWSLPVYQAMSRTQAHYGVSCANALPIPSAMQCWSYRLRKLKDVIWTCNTRAILYFLKRFVLRKTEIVPAKFVFAGGEKSFRNQYPVESSTEILYIHSYDYDIYLNEREKELTSQEAIVFLEDQFTHSPEFAMYNERPAMDSDRYFDLMNNFFDFVENVTGCEVIISVHPRSNQNDLSICFKGRKCIKGQTAHLVRGSKLVLAHYSTAISFANLFGRPLMFMSFKDIAGTFEDNFIKEMAKWHGKEPVLLDNLRDINLDKMFDVNIQLYNNYRKAFIKGEDSEELPFWQIVVNRLKTMLENN